MLCSAPEQHGQGRPLREGREAPHAGTRRRRSSRTPPRLLWETLRAAGQGLQQRWNRGFLLGHEFGGRSEAYAELYDLQDANRLPLGRGTGNYAASGVKQRETTLALGGRQALNHQKTLNLLLLGGRSFQKPSAATGQPSWIAYVGLQVLLGPKEAGVSQPSGTDITGPDPLRR